MFSLSHQTSVLKTLISYTEHAYYSECSEFVFIDFYPRPLPHQQLLPFTTEIGSRVNLLCSSGWHHCGWPRDACNHGEYKVRWQPPCECFLTMGSWVEYKWAFPLMALQCLDPHDNTMKQTIYIPTTCIQVVWEARWAIRFMNLHLPASTAGASMTGSFQTTLCIQFAWPC